MICVFKGGKKLQSCIFSANLSKQSGDVGRNNFLFFSTIYYEYLECRLKDSVGYNFYGI
jgi:hypothetical protein